MTTAEPTPATLPTTNWCATATIASPERSYAVADAAQAAELFAARPDSRVQLLGSRFSHPALLEGTDGMAVHLRTRGPKVLRLDASTVTVTGDCTLTELWEHVRDWGLTLPVCPPVITEQTVAGAIATGTHAQGLGEGLLADAVTAVAYVDAAGQEHEVTADQEEFGAFLLHLGCLGLVTRLTLAVRPNTRYHCVKYTTSGTDLQQDFALWNARSAHVKAWWWVDEDRAHVWEVNPAAGPQPPHDHLAVAHTDLNPILAATQARLGDDTGDHNNDAAPQRTVGRFYDYSDVEGDLVEIFRNGIPAPQVNMEVGVPLDRFTAAAADLRATVGASPFRLHYPVILRPTGPSQAWLSSAYGRAVVWFGFVVYQRPDGSVADGSVELLGDIQRTLATHGGLPHWGKYFDEARFDLAALPRLADFRAVRARLDPGRRFLSARVAQVLHV
ncbi:FAD/FMN-containing dehydrogenase [Raineyella antarctica]|uniref:FAD/FMN-containing dehydrogenase n=1 Tax=Raineyella antarctica TaxID=1577474 RepID=A0A1G6H7D4_9ACTN|nr:D-arabinono-1,4-lactone oxidase [Raineyella antarctica]SDB89855.1 FAD/FMN-containing dehydrogenase [Raineyella antarctica]